MPAASRSALMARITGRGNRSTEGRMVLLLRSMGIKGWRRHATIAGRPDFVFRDRRVVLFVDGCFWHRCPVHFKMPGTRRSFWVRKIAANKRRDRLVTRELAAAGWTVIRIWEHELDASRIWRTRQKLERSLKTQRLRQTSRDRSEAVRLKNDSS